MEKLKSLIEWGLRRSTEKTNPPPFATNGKNFDKWLDELVDWSEIESKKRSRPSPSAVVAAIPKALVGAAVAWPLTILLINEGISDNKKKPITNSELIWMPPDERQKLLDDVLKMSWSQKVAISGMSVLAETGMALGNLSREAEREKGEIGFVGKAGKVLSDVAQHEPKGVIWGLAALGIIIGTAVASPALMAGLTLARPWLGGLSAKMNNSALKKMRKEKVEEMSPLEKMDYALRVISTGYGMNRVAEIEDLRVSNGLNPNEAMACVLSGLAAWIKENGSEMDEEHLLEGVKDKDRERSSPKRVAEYLLSNLKIRTRKEERGESLKIESIEESSALDDVFKKEILRAGASIVRDAEIKGLFSSSAMDSVALGKLAWLRVTGGGGIWADDWMKKSAEFMDEPGDEKEKAWLVGAGGFFVYKNGGGANVELKKLLAAGLKSGYGANCVEGFLTEPKRSGHSWIPEKELNEALALHEKESFERLSGEEVKTPKKRRL